MACSRLSRQTFPLVVEMHRPANSDQMVKVALENRTAGSVGGLGLQRIGRRYVKRTAEQCRGASQTAVVFTLERRPAQLSFISLCVAHKLIKCNHLASRGPAARARFRTFIWEWENGLILCVCVVARNQKWLTHTRPLACF